MNFFLFGVLCKVYSYKAKHSQNLSYFNVLQTKVVLVLVEIHKN